MTLPLNQARNRQALTAGDPIEARQLEENSEDLSEGSLGVQLGDSGLGFPLSETLK